MAPNFSDYFRRVKYDSYDVTALIGEGKNTIGVEVGPGWYAGNPKWWGWQMTFHGNPRLAVELTVHYTDGTSETVTADETWKMCHGSVVSSCIYDGEEVDFAAEPDGWNLTGFDDSAWDSAVTVEAPLGELTPLAAPPVRIIRTLTPVKSWKISDTQTVYDFGENGTALPQVTVRGAAGEWIRLNHAEHIHEDGTLDAASELLAECTDLYHFPDDRERVCRPKFTWHGYRYMMLTVSSPRVDVLAVESHIIHSDLGTTGHFACDRADLNRLHEVYRRTGLACLQAVPLDCQQRNERKAWLGDAWVTAETCFYNFDMKDFYADFLEDLRVGSLCLDRLPIIYPAAAIECDVFGGMSTSMDWVLAYPEMVAEYDARYDDASFVAHHYPAMARMLSYFTAAEKDGFIPFSWFGDWFSTDYPEGQEKVVFCPGGEDHHVNPPFAGTMFYCQALRLMTGFARRIGNTAEAERYRALWERSRQALLARCYHADTAIFGDGGQFLLTYALAEELVPAEDRERVFANLVTAFEKADGHCRMGVIGTRRMFEVLRSFGRDDIAYRALTAPGYPGPLDMIGADCTTLPEGLDGSGSGCHAMFDSPDAMLYRMIGGITVDRLGETPLVIQPYCPGDLTFASARQTLAEGTVAVEWRRREDGKVVFTIDIPQDMEAEIRLPGTPAMRRGGGRYEMTV